MPDQAKSNKDTQDVTMAVLHTKMEMVLEKLDTALDILNNFDTRLRSGETDIVLLKSSQQSIVIKLDNMDERLEEVEDLVPVVRIVKWAGAILGGAVLLLLWAIFTGQTTLGK
ncbi:hemolysin xhlA [Caudoviricetes sp.]|nr:hemolysin xhlA [Caudoviricetes sp.]UOF81128.1 hemolysin xhlA [Caudoviricetes sp.]UOF82236.1 hemolysin xhlA [Caudoviricetes sp.]UOF82473.1 hemolysin xhlA [Caudoviricetes sp.]UOF82627.1 hemolysin xhlA [Caudoviricetes sp.]